MQIDLSELLSIDGETRSYDVNVDMDTFRSKHREYKIAGRKPFVLTVQNTGKRRLKISGEGMLSLNIPCDRCLEDVQTDISFSIEKSLDLSGSDSDRIEVEEDFCNGSQLDVDRLVTPEIFLNLPGKVLCRPDCKGLCPNCGKDLNAGECGCNTESLDPRMSVIQDIFKKFKEV